MQKLGAVLQRLLYKLPYGLGAGWYFILPSPPIIHALKKLLRGAHLKKLSVFCALGASYLCHVVLVIYVLTNINHYCSDKNRPGRRLQLQTRP